jgi:hypothetical protein
MAFAACSRGLLESAGDTFEGLKSVPLTMAQHARGIRQALGGHSRRVFSSQELENTLIHFAYARKLRRDEEAPVSHRAKQVSEYLAPLTRNEPLIKPLYQELCDVVHSGASSAHAFLHVRSKNTYFLSRKEEIIWIHKIGEDLLRSMKTILEFAFNLGLLTLRVLNHLPVKSLHTESVEIIRFDNVPMWRRIEAYLTQTM